MIKLFKREPKTPFEELKDVFVAAGKAFVLRNALKDGVDIGDLDEAFSFVQAMPEAIAGAKDISFEELTEAQIDELVEVVIETWEVPDSPKVREAIPKLVRGILFFSQGMDILL